MAIKHALIFLLALAGTGYSTPVAEFEGEILAPREDGNRTALANVGFSTVPYGGQYCGGTNQGNTNVNRGTAACINTSNAVSLRVNYKSCSRAVARWYDQLNCKGRMYAQDIYPRPAGTDTYCRNLVNIHASAWVFCEGDSN